MLTVAILAGGLATRLRPLTENIPKSLVPINGEPFLSHQLRLLRSRGVERVVLCLGHLGERIRDFLGEGGAFGLRVQYSWDGPVPLGTAGAIRAALPLLGEAFFVVYGDSYLPCDYRAVERAFALSGRQGLMTVFANEGRWDTSNVEFSEGRILAYDKRRKTERMRYIDYGLGIFERSVFARLPEAPCDLADVYRELLARDELAAFEVAERFYEIGSLEGGSSLSEWLASPGGNRLREAP
jgi:N-acetyl-alpha-D-muramate 1-phosphate uridylyltransferase